MKKPTTKAGRDAKALRTFQKRIEVHKKLPRLNHRDDTIGAIWFAMRAFTLGWGVLKVAYYSAELYGVALPKNVLRECHALAPQMKKIMSTPAD